MHHHATQLAGLGMDSLGTGLAGLAMAGVAGALGIVGVLECSTEEQRIRSAPTHKSGRHPSYFGGSADATEIDGGYSR